MPTMRTTQLQTKTVLFWNCARGIFSKKPIVEKYIKDQNPSVFFISECDVTKSHLVESLNIDGYRVELSGTYETRNKGRILAYVRTKDNLVKLKNYENDQNDIIVLGDKDGLLLIGLYAGFKVIEKETVSGNFERLLENLKNICERTSSSLVIGGDFNSDLDIVSTKSKALEIWQSEFGLDQQVKTYTRERLVLDKL